MPSCCEAPMLINPDDIDRLQEIAALVVVLVAVGVLIVGAIWR